MNYLNFTFSARDEVISFPFNGETLLVPTPNNLADLNFIIAVNDAGWIFWQELMKGLTPNEICHLWAAKSGIDLRQLQHLALNILSILKPILKENHEDKI
jgi:hypothetical protein